MIPNPNPLTAERSVSRTTVSDLQVENPAASYRALGCTPASAGRIMHLWAWSILMLQLLGWILDSLCATHTCLPYSLTRQAGCDAAPRNCRGLCPTFASGSGSDVRLFLAKLIYPAQKQTDSHTANSRFPPPSKLRVSSGVSLMNAST